MKKYRNRLRNAFKDSTVFGKTMLILFFPIWLLSGLNSVWDNEFGQVKQSEIDSTPKDLNFGVSPDYLMKLVSQIYKIPIGEISEVGSLPNNGILSTNSLGSVSEAEIQWQIKLRTAICGASSEGYKACTKLILYRQKLSIEYLKAPSDRTKDSIKEMIEDCNDKIKLTLGV